MKKLGIYLITIILILSISFIGLTSETTVSDLLKRIENIESRLTRIEEKMGENFKVPDAAKTYNINDKFELSRVQFRKESYGGVEILGELKNISKDYDVINLNLILYEKNGKIIDTIGLGKFDFKKGTTQTFKKSTDVIDDPDKIDGFKVEIGS
jgi:hypothetical protein